MKLFSDLRQKFSHYSIKGKVVTVLWITLIWILVRLFKFFESYASNMDSMEFKKGIVSSILIIMAVASIIGASLVFLWERWLRKMAYFKAIFFILLFYSLVFFIFYPLEQTLAGLRNSNQPINAEELARQFKGVFNR